MKKPMTIEDALELVLQAADHATIHFLKSGHAAASAMLSQAAEILRNMEEEPVGKRSTASGYKCIGCGHTHVPCGNCPSCGKSSYTALPIRGKKTWTETRVLKIVKQKTDVKFEEVD